MKNLFLFVRMMSSRAGWLLLLLALLWLAAGSRSGMAINRYQQTVPPVNPTRTISEGASSQQIFLPLVSSARFNNANEIPTRAADEESTPNGTPFPTTNPELTAQTTPDSGSAELPPTAQPTPGLTQSPTIAPTFEPPFEETIEPTVEPTTEPTIDPVLAQCTADLADVAPHVQQERIEAELGCAEPFVDLLITDPTNHLETFYALITSTVTSDVLWSITYERARLGEFRFSDGAAIEDLWVNLPRAVAGCQGAFRCGDWATFVLPYLTAGDMYRCPDFAGLSTEKTTLSVPYGDYYCTEDLASHLATVVDEAAVNQLMLMGASLEQGWSRRNAIRVLGRMAAQPTGSIPQVLITQTMRESVSAFLLDRLLSDASPEVLQDLIWVLDSYFFPALDAQPALEGLSANSDFDSTVRFRAIAAASRIIDQKAQLEPSDQQYLEASLASDDLWVRAQAAFALQLAEDSLVDDAQRTSVISALQNAYDTEVEFTVLTSLAQALDLYSGTDLRGELQVNYEAAHLSSRFDFNQITIRSGLPAAELPAFITRMRNTEAAFFAELGASFESPVPGDPTEAMTLLLFANRDEYRTYMNAFVGYGAEAGGLYLEGWGTLYTYQRTPTESAYTVEHLIQHEFAHYLQGRYLFPGLWTDAGYHTQPKGWVDEGTAEFFGFANFDEEGLASHPLPASRLVNLCGASSFRRISDLLAQRSGYDQPGTFDYDNAWAFIHYLMTAEPSQALEIYQAFREERYQLANFATLIDRPIAALEADWHDEMAGWCSEQANQIQAASLNGPVPRLEIIHEVAQENAPQPPAAAPQPPGEQFIRLVQP